MSGAGCRPPACPTASSRRPPPTRSNRCSTRWPVACARSWPPAWRRSTEASATPTSWTAACRTRSCSSCSPTLGSGRRSGRRVERRPLAGAGAVSVAELQALERDYVIPTYARAAVEFVRGLGSRLWDSEGNEYLDFFSGVGVTNTGHCHPAVVEAVQRQAERLMHTSNLYYTEPAMRLARRLAESSLGGKVFFTNSGAEATEAALKLARRFKAGGEIVVSEGAVHGRTYGALSATPQETKQAPFAPLVPGARTA